MNRAIVLPLSFGLLLGLGTWRHLEAAAAASPSPVKASIVAMREEQPPPASTTVAASFPDHWLNGEDCESATPLQVHAYDFVAGAMASRQQCQIFDEFVLHPVVLCGIGWNG